MGQLTVNPTGPAHSSDAVSRRDTESDHYKLLVIVDDEPFRNRLLTLADELGVHTRQETAAIDAILAYRANWMPNAIVIDQLVPRSEYYAAIRALRSVFGVPVLAVTAEPRSTDQMPERGVLLLGREAAFAEIRRLAHSGTSDDAVISIGALSLDRSGCTAMVRGNPVHLHPDEAITLALLMQHPGAVIHRRTLVSALGGLQRDLDPRIIDVHVIRLMVKLGSDAPVTIERSQDREGYILRPIDPRIVLTAQIA